MARFEKKTASEKISEAQEVLGAAVESLVTGEDWARYLETQAKFHKYSANNCLLIAMQCPQATQVAGYNQWRDNFGRQVRKGEKSIKILAPMIFKVKGEDGAPILTHDSDGNVVGEQKRIWFKVVSVFDIGQTEGDPLPSVTMPELLTGEAPNGLWDALAAQVKSQGFTLERGDCGQANGWTCYDTKTVRVREDVSAAQAVKTLAHELAHVMLHNPEARSARQGVTRDRAEVEAESVAYVVCSVRGLDSSGYTLGYVAHWSEGKAEIVKETAKAVADCARAILTKLEGEGESEETPAYAEAA
jgi:hypothetical protein